MKNPRTLDGGTTAYNAPFSLPREWYYDPVIYERETDRIFYGSWRLAAHRSELAASGDYVTVDFCGESLVLIRGGDRVLRGFYNVCQHRGHRLLEGRGHIDGTIVCPITPGPTGSTANCAVRQTSMP